MPQREAIAKCLAKINEGRIKGVLVTVEPEHDAVRNILDTVPDVKILAMHRMEDVHELFVFLMLHRNSKVLLDTGDFFKTGNVHVTQKAAHMIARALDGSRVHSYSSSRTFVFEGQIVMTTHHRDLVPMWARSRMYVC